MSINVRFLEDDYMTSNKVMSKIDLRNLDKIPTTTKKYHGSSTNHFCF